MPLVKFKRPRVQRASTMHASRDTRGRSVANIRGGRRAAVGGFARSRLFRNRRLPSPLLLLLLLLIGATSILRPLQNAFVAGDIDRMAERELGPKYLRL